jgi:hypothetical protein
MRGGVHDAQRQWVPKVLIRIERVGAGRNHVLTYRLHFDDGLSALTKVGDAGVSDVILPELIGPVLVAFDHHRRVVDISPITGHEGDNA